MRRVEKGTDGNRFRSFGRASDGRFFGPGVSGGGHHCHSAFGGHLDRSIDRVEFVRKSVRSAAQGHVDNIDVGAVFVLF